MTSATATAIAPGEPSRVVPEGAAQPVSGPTLAPVLPPLQLGRVTIPTPVVLAPMAGITNRAFVFRFRSPEHWLEVFRTYYGPMFKTFAALDADRQAALTQDVLQLMAAGNRSGDSTLVLPSEYLEVVIARR